MSESKRPPRKTLRTDAGAMLATCAGWTSRLAARRINQFLEARMAGTGLTLAQFGLMAQIAVATDDTMAGLAARMDLDPSTLSRNLRALSDSGLVEIAMVDGDLRRRMVWLTESGARRLEAAITAWRAAHQALAKVFPVEEARRLAQATDAIAMP
jgi:DNA-binding MarR family transcriptional regulator